MCGGPTHRDNPKTVIPASEPKSCNVGAIKGSDISDRRLRGNDISDASGTLLQVIGAGPAGMGLVLALCNRVAAQGRDAESAQRLLDSLMIFEASARPGGNMSRYRINANTSSPDVVQGIADGTPFVGVRDRYLEHEEARSDLIFLPRIGELMVAPLVQAMVEFLHARLQCGTEIRRIEIDARGFSSYDADNRLRASSGQLLFCCGADDKPLDELLVWRDRWEGSARFLMRDNLDGLPPGKRPIVIIGASHSAFSCAWRLLNDPLYADFAADREIIILHRRERIKLRVTPEFARRHRIEFDPQNDVCPSTGLVFFNGGLRKDAKFLYLDIRDRREQRVRMVPMAEIDEQRELLAGAGLILQATGFSHRLPRIERDGRALRVGKPTRDGELRDLDSGEIIPGCFGMGLGFNILPEREPPGEPGFNGGIHGFQSYPLAVAPPIIDRLIASPPAEARH